MKKVMVFGAFDGLHAGHIDFFKQAKECGDYLIVVVARDKTIKKVKKCSPSLDENERLKAVQNCKLVNEVKLGYENNPYRLIKEMRPDAVCLGYDQKSFTKNLPREIERMKLKTKIYRMEPYQSQKYHSSIINKK